MALGNLLQGYIAAQHGNQAAAGAQIQQYGALQKILMQQQEKQKAQQFQQEVSQARTPEERLAVAQKYMGANQLGASIQGAETATATRDATAAQREATLALQREGLRQRGAEAEANRQQRMSELKMRLAEGRLTEQDRIAAKQELAEMIVSGQRDVAQMRADTQRDIASLRQENSPQAVKEREKVAGKSSLTSLLDELSEDYKSLETLGSDISPSRGAMSNIYNRAASSGAGQIAAGAVGTKSQEVRDSINQKRASLMAALKQATGMGATQLNSNVELQFYLRMATDPTMARGANKKAIKWLRDTYGIQGGAAEGPAPTPTPAPQGGGSWAIRPLP